MNDLEHRIQALEAFMESKKVQQITAPIDEASRNSLGAAVGRGAGSTGLTSSVTVPAGGSTFNVPKAYLGTVILEVDGVRYEIPYLSTP